VFCPIQNLVTTLGQYFPIFSYLQDPDCSNVFFYKVSQTANCFISKKMHCLQYMAWSESLTADSKIFNWNQPCNALVTTLTLKQNVIIETYKINVRRFITLVFFFLRYSFQPTFLTLLPLHVFCD